MLPNLTVRKEEFLKGLDLAIPLDFCIREAILGLAQILILEDDQRSFVGDLSDERIKVAIQAYRKVYSENGEATPVLSELLHSLMKENAVDRAASLDERLEYIHNKLADFGCIAPEGTVEIGGSDILLLRILSDTTIDEL